MPSEEYEIEENNLKLEVENKILKEENENLKKEIDERITNELKKYIEKDMNLVYEERYLD